MAPVVPAAAAVPVVAAPVAPARPAVAPVISAPVALAQAPQICGRCRGAGDPGAEFCKFCGARYSDVSPVQVDPRREFVGPTASMAASPVPVGTARIVTIRKDGSDGESYAISGDRFDVGRTEGEVALGDDIYLSPRHARLERAADGWMLRDLDTLNGIYVRLHDPVELFEGSMFLIGQQVLRFETLNDAERPLGPASTRGVFVFGTPENPRVARLVQYTTEGVGRDVHYLYRDETVLGRENGDIVFPDDPFLSRRHAAVRAERASRKFFLHDMGSSNGTAIRIRGEHRLRSGDQFRVGRHLFRFDDSVAGGTR